MRILQYLPSLASSVGGPARAVPDLCRALAAHGHKVTLATSDPADVAEDWRRDQPPNARIEIFPPPVGADRGFPRRAHGRISEAVGKNDIIHLHGVWSFANIQIGRMASAAGKRYVVSPRGMLDDWPMAQKSAKKRAFLALLGRRWLEGAHRIHFTAQSEMRQAAGRISVKRGLVIPNLLDLLPYGEPSSPTLAETKFNLAPSGRPRVLFLSRIHPKKGLDVLIAASAALKSRNRPVTLLIAGDGEPDYLSRMKELAADSGISDSTTFLGQVSGKLKLSLFAACDVLAIPTHHENFGFVFVEALASALPTLTTPNVGIWEELQASGGATIIPPDPEAFAQAIQDTLELETGIRACREDARRWVFDWLDPENLVPRYSALYMP